MSRPRSFVLLPLIALLLIGWSAPSAKSSAALDPLPVGEAQSTGYPLLAELHGQNASLLTLAISPDGALLAASGDAGVIDLWTLSDQQPAGSLTGHTATVNTLAFSPDGATLASGSDDSTVRVWDLSSLTEASRFKPTMATNVYRVDYSPSGSELAVGAQLCVVQLVNPSSGILRRTLDQPGCGSTSLGWVKAWGIDYLPEGEGLLTGDGRGCCGGALIRWEEDRFLEPLLLAGYGLPVSDIAVDGAGDLVAVSALGEPAVWIREIATGALVHEMIGHIFRVNALAFSPDGARLASVSRDGNLVLWDVETGKEAARLSPKAGPLTDVAFTPDGKLLAASTEDGRVLVWDLAGG